MLPPLFFRSMSVVVANAFIYMLDRLLSELQSFRAVAAFIVFSPLQFFRGCLQVTERFLHVGLIFTESESRYEQNQSHNNSGECIWRLAFHVSSSFLRMGITTAATQP
jgi:hypothetical protein